MTTTLSEIINLFTSLNSSYARHLADAITTEFYKSCQSIIMFIYKVGFKAVA